MVNSKILKNYLKNLEVGKTKGKVFKAKEGSSLVYVIDFYNFIKTANLPSVFQEKLVNDKDWYVRMAIAKNPNLDPKFHEKLVNDEYWYIREAMANRNDLGSELREKLLNDKDTEVRAAMENNPNYRGVK